MAFKKPVFPLRFDNSLVNAVIDRFGKDVSLDKVDDNSFSVRINIAISSTFFAWLAQFGNKVKILSPESVIEKYKHCIQEILEQYK
jgi:predicted DNA-binding transcriptional regulator YafY